MGYNVLRNIYPSTLRLFRDQRWVRTIFFFALALKCHGNCHKYLCQTNSSALRYSLLLCRSQSTKRDDALSHWCNPNLHPCAQDLKQAQQQQKLSLEKSQLCPQTPFSSTHVPVKTLEPRLISNGIHPDPHISITHTHPYKPLYHLELRHTSTCRRELYQPSNSFSFQSTQVA